MGILNKLRAGIKWLISGRAGDITDHPQATTPVSKDLEENARRLKRLMEQCYDMKLRRVQLGEDGAVGALIFFIDGMVKKEEINESILKPLLIATRDQQYKFNAGNALCCIEERILSYSDIQEEEGMERVISRVLGGDTALFIDGFAIALICDTKGWEKRPVDDPVAEVVTRGPRDSFTESIRVNTALLRRRLRTPDLYIERAYLGKYTQTEVAIIYIGGLVAPALVAEVKTRLARIKVDEITGASTVEEFIEDTPYSPIPTIFKSERPDVIASKILEGRVGILVDGTPFVLTVPTMLTEFLHSAEDYYQRGPVASLARIFRILSLGITVLAPGLYVAVSTFHQEMIPAPLLMTMVAAREGIPFPILVEVIILGLIFEILREAGLRMPRAMGQAVSIVGAIILGDAAVRAGIVSAPGVIVAALTGITIFIIPFPEFAQSLVIFRLSLTILAGVLGFFGMIMGLLAMVVYWSSVRNFGVPFLAPFAPTILADMRDNILRLPWWRLTKRPASLDTPRPTRQQVDLKPQKPKQGEGGADA